MVLAYRKSKFFNLNFGVSYTIAEASDLYHFVADLWLIQIKLQLTFLDEEEARIKSISPVFCLTEVNTEANSGTHGMS